jgi:hypothetical protein
MDSKARINFRFKTLVSSGVNVLGMVYPHWDNIFRQNNCVAAVPWAMPQNARHGNLGLAADCAHSALSNHI